MSSRYQVLFTDEIMQVVIGQGAVGTQMARSGNLLFSSGLAVASVVFATILPGVVADYIVLGTMQNTLDPFPMELTPRISAFSSSGFTVTVPNPVDSANYSFNWLVVGVVNG